MGRVLQSHELVCHVDGYTFNNEIDNLIVGTARQNALDKIRSNTNGHKLRNQNIFEIRRLADSGLSPRKIAVMFNISVSHAAKIIRRKAWFNLR